MAISSCCDDIRNLCLFISCSACPCWLHFQAGLPQAVAETATSCSGLYPTYTLCYIRGTLTPTDSSDPSRPSATSVAEPVEAVVPPRVTHLPGGLSRTQSAWTGVGAVEGCCVQEHSRCPLGTSNSTFSGCRAFYMRCCVWIIHWEHRFNTKVFVFQIAFCFTLTVWLCSEVCPDTF